MGILLGVYKELAKEAEVAQTYEMLQERVDVLSKYAEVATELLSAEFPNDFDKADVVELADKLIQRDVEIADAQEKTAEAVELLGEYVKAAQVLLDETGNEYYSSTVEKLASALFEIDAEAQFNKEASVIAEASFVDELNKIAETNFSTLEEVEEVLKVAAPGGAGLLEGIKGFAGKAMGAGKNLVADVGAGFKNMSKNNLLGKNMPSGTDVFNKDLIGEAQKVTRQTRLAAGAAGAGVLGLGGIGAAIGRKSGGDK